MEQLRKACALD